MVTRQTQECRGRRVPQVGTTLLAGNHHSNSLARRSTLRKSICVPPPHWGSLTTSTIWQCNDMKQYSTCGTRPNSLTIRKRNLSWVWRYTFTLHPVFGFKPRKNFWRQKENLAVKTFLYTHFAGKSSNPLIWAENRRIDHNGVAAGNRR